MKQNQVILFGYFGRQRGKGIYVAANNDVTFHPIDDLLSLGIAAQAVSEILEKAVSPEVWRIAHLYITPADDDAIRQKVFGDELYYRSAWARDADRNKSWYRLLACFAVAIAANGWVREITDEDEWPGSGFRVHGEFLSDDGDMQCTCPSDTIFDLGLAGRVLPPSIYSYRHCIHMFAHWIWTKTGRNTKKPVGLSVSVDDGSVSFHEDIGRGNPLDGLTYRPLFQNANVRQLHYWQTRGVYRYGLRLLHNLDDNTQAVVFTSGDSLLGTLVKFDGTDKEDELRHIGETLSSTVYLDAENAELIWWRI